jgi:hypothetical protein
VAGSRAGRVGVRAAGVGRCSTCRYKTIAAVRGRPVAADFGYRYGLPERRAGVRSTLNTRKGADVHRVLFVLGSVRVYLVEGSEARRPGRQRCPSRRSQLDRSRGTGRRPFPCRHRSVAHTHVDDQATKLVVERSKPARGYGGSNATDESATTVACHPRSPRGSEINGLC